MAVASYFERCLDTGETRIAGYITGASKDLAGKKQLSCEIHKGKAHPMDRIIVVLDVDDLLNDFRCRDSDGVLNDQYFQAIHERVAEKVKSL